jgi:hypothetical protein
MKRPLSDSELAEIRSWVARHHMLTEGPLLTHLLETAEEACRSPSTTILVDLLGRLDKAKAMIDRLRALPTIQFDDPFLAEELAELRAELDR